MPDAQRERYRSLLEVHGFVTWLAPLVRWGLFFIGLSLFMAEAMQLVGGSLGQSERIYHGVIAVSAFLGCWLVGVVLGRLLATGADLAEVLVDIEVASERTAELTERHVVPALNKIAASVEGSAPASPRGGPTAGNPKPQASAAARPQRGSTD
jgi:hypothetical protein